METIATIIKAIDFVGKFLLLLALAWLSGYKIFTKFWDKTIINEKHQSPK